MKLDMSKWTQPTILATEMVNVLDSVLGVSKGLSEAGEVGVVMLWRRDDLQQPGVHVLWKTT